MTGPIFHMIPDAPRPVAPYSHVVERDGWLFVTGQLATDPEDDALPLPDGIEAQTRKVMDNLARALRGAGASLADVVCVRIFLMRFEQDYAAMNALYASYFPADACPPAPRSALPLSPAAASSRSTSSRSAGKLSMAASSMTALDQQTPEQHRQRYDRLLAQARERPQEPRALACPDIAADRVLYRETVPGGRYWTGLIPRGRSLRVVNTAGSSSVSVLLWNAHATSERLNTADTAKVQWTVRGGAGQVLLSDMGRVLASIAADTCSGHDLLVGGSTRASNVRRYGRDDHRNTRDNFLLAAAKHGLDRRDIPPCLTLFAGVRADGAGHLAWHRAAPAGSAVGLRAEMDLLVALSNCPHPLDPAHGYAAQPIEAITWASAPVGTDDPCRTGSPEAVRAFQNNARMSGG